MRGTTRWADRCRRGMRGAALLAVLFAAALPAPGRAAPAAKEVTVTFQEIDTLFRNPGKGWMAFGRLPGREPRFPCSVAYFRLDWKDLEPAEGEFRWGQIDEAIEAWKARGADVAFRIMTANAHSAGYYCSPQWLFDAGCRAHEYLRGGEDTMEGGKRIPRAEPDYSDPLYLAKHGAFIRALAQRYDGHPNVAFLDVGSYGIWGEWHSPNPVGVEVRRQIADMYLDGFRRTPLVMMSDDAEILDHGFSKGAGFRRDGVGSPWHEKTWIGSEKYAKVRGFADAWKRAPVVFEWFGPYDFLLRRGWSFDSAVKFILDNHVTILNDNIGAVPEEQMPKLRELARRSGYRFVLREASYPERVARGGALRLAMKWSNVGVGRLYREYPLALYLLDAGGKVVQQSRAHADARQWLPGDHAVTEELAIPASLAPGEYTLGLAFLDAGGRPAIALACDAPETERLYRLGTVRVE